uniref:Uncharacterized protein n=1 Tax=Mycolicibacterium gilvum (strain PYR-GCK) TaxID=350054 RepID=A4T799_MYCGI|nr:hypothetical protein Mflv_1725 [Mycolicibacterium gilvum PYR-GCK]
MTSSLRVLSTGTGDVDADPLSRRNSSRGVARASHHGEAAGEIGPPGHREQQGRAVAERDADLGGQCGRLGQNVGRRDVTDADGAGDVQAVHGEFERPGRQVAAQPDALSADHLDQRIADAVQIGERPGHQGVDGPGRIRSQILSRPAAAFDDRGGVDARREVVHPHVVRRRTPGVLTLGGGTQIRADGDQRARGVSDQVAHRPFAQPRLIPAVVRYLAHQSRESVCRRSEDGPGVGHRRVSESQPSTDSGPRGAGPT